MDDAVIDGIERRRDGKVAFDERAYEGVFIAMEWLFEDNGLPSPYSRHGEEFLHWMEGVAELLFRWENAKDNGRQKDADFIAIQIRGLIAQGKERWSSSPGPAPICYRPQRYLSPGK